MNRHSARHVKQHLRIETPQSWQWQGQGPERVALIEYFTYGIVWTWFIRNGEHCRISESVPDGDESSKLAETFVESLFRAA